MHHYRSKRQHYARLNKSDKQRGDCSFCTDETLSGRVIEEYKTMHLIPNRTHYDMFEGLRVHDHLMIIPKRHLESIDDFTEEEKIEMMSIAGKYERQGYSVYARGVGSINRSVKHQHTHLLKLRNIRAKFVFYMRRPYFLIDR